MKQKSKAVFWFFALLMVLGCATDPLEMKWLSGYWEIDFVEHQGERFVPKVGQPLYDFYQLEQNNGFRKKVVPKFDGTYATSTDQTAFTLKQQKEKPILQFETPWDSWSEQIVYLDSTKLILFHNNNRYHYKRP